MNDDMKLEQLSSYFQLACAFTKRSCRIVDMCLPVKQNRILSDLPYDCFGTLYRKTR